MRFPPLSFAVIDTETTGFLPRVHHIAEFACVRYEKGEVATTYEQLIKTPDELPAHVQVLTRIRPAMLEGKPTFAEAALGITQAIGPDTILVGQNLGYDLGMLKGEGMDLTHRAWIDTSLLAALVFPEFKSYSLQYLSNALKLPHDPPHRALGDVRATAALLGAVWERLCELPAARIAEAKEVMARSSEGYRLLFDALPAGGGDGAWFAHARRHAEGKPAAPATIPAAAEGSVTLFEESLDPAFVPSLIAGAAKEDLSTWIAVKNLDTSLRRHGLPQDAVIVYPPSLLLNPEAAARMKEQETLLPEEATLTLKIDWFAPAHRADLALHAGERDTWNGKLACTEEHPLYRAQYQKDARVHLVDHRQLLSFLGAGADGTEAMMRKGSRVIVDDASMLEDTATKAFGSYLALDDLRAAAQGHPLLTRLADSAALWAETLRGGADQYPVQPNDFTRPETTGLKRLLDELATDASFPQRVRYLLKEFTRFLSPVRGRATMTWIETRAQSGSVSLHSAPERIDLLLKEALFDPYKTILLVPPALNGKLPSVLPADTPKTLVAAPEDALRTLPIAFPETALHDLLSDPPAGKTIALVSSKRVAEIAYVNFTEQLEARGITLIAQGLGGGQGRMESDFLASEGTVLWLLTPWIYEGIDLPEGSADHFFLESLPFDHPGQPVFSRRKDLFRNGFEEYALVRLQHRLFRLLRTYARHRTTKGDVAILDKRMRDKAYGETIRDFLERFSAGGNAPAFVTKTVGEKAVAPVKKSPKKKKPDGPQQSLPL